MPYTSDSSLSDFAKLQLAFQEISSKFGSFDDILVAFGLADMPTAQRYGILFGCMVFLCTITAVLLLLTLGGSFRRIAEQAETGEVTLLSATEARRQRALILEQLLEGRERMMQNYPDPTRTDQLTNLTKMLMNEAPVQLKDDGHGLGGSSAADQFQADENTNAANLPPEETAPAESKASKNKNRYVPPFYEENYTHAYRKCQDRPGGAVLSGRPEARYEAYARGFAGCGPYVSLEYRRSYGRMYEAICCQNHQTDDKYTKLFSERPHDIVGKYVRLEPLDVSRHLSDIFQVTSGESVNENKSYDPQEVWGFLEDGPFGDEAEMRQSFVFQRNMNEAGFAMVNSITDKMLGVVLLRNDDPRNLSIQLEAPIMPPGRDGTKEQFEACFLLLDRLFAYGYRRIQISLDAQDTEKGKLCMRLGFSLEGRLYKHMVVKEASRDSNIYGLLNSDWKRGARAALYKKLYGNSAFRADIQNERTEDEFEERARCLKEQKKQQAEADSMVKSKSV